MRDLLSDPEGAAANDPEQRARELSKRELPKRFYKKAEAAKVDGGFAIHLDGRAVKTPAKVTLLLPTLTLAEAVAAEWEAQEKEIDPGKMPLTRISNSAQDAVTSKFADVADEITRFVGNDALCYRADGPETLVTRQRELWDPVLNWAGDALGGVFVLIEGIIHKEQPEALLSSFRTRLDALSPLQLSALHTATTLTGSAVLAYALFEKRVTADEAWKAAFVEEDWNIERWGEDAESSQMRVYKRKEFDAAVLILEQA
ncbi:ATP12 chaperone protein [Roseibium sp. TrichSKD4]|uniref:ATP12 family chaperone protein n=1 Tax=Roseibium sp. TrichSKD4 TaxID=744980 RepID=UPI0001E573E9|nr:ATP12 family protein [Roseibium sp. TrichSKD4]EFO29216.1 ATP12 chaperone protein [Roseibium sp. TrichSKD4]